MPICLHHTSHKSVRLRPEADMRWKTCGGLVRQKQLSRRLVPMRVADAKEAGRTIYAFCCRACTNLCVCLDELVVRGLSIKVFEIEILKATIVNDALGANREG